MQLAFDSSLLDVDYVSETQQEAKPVKVRRKRSTSSDDIDQMSLIFSNTVIEEIEESSSRRKSKLDIAAEAEADFVWTDEHAMILHDVFLERTLHTLMDTRCSLESQREIWAWVNAPFVEEGETPIPFSFQACCDMTALDHERLRESLEWQTRHEAFRKEATH